MTYEGLVPGPAMEQFVPRVFGFRIHPISNSLPKHHSAVTDFNVGNGALVGKNVGVSDFGSGSVMIAAPPHGSESNHAPISRAKSVFLKAKTTSTSGGGGNGKGVASSSGGNLGPHGFSASAATSLSAQALGQAAGADSHNSVSEETVNAGKNDHQLQASSDPNGNMEGVVAAEEVSSESRKGSRQGSGSGSGNSNSNGSRHGHGQGHRHGYLHSHKASGGHAGESSGRHPKREKDMTGINDEEDGQVKRSKSVV